MNTINISISITISSSTSTSTNTMPVAAVVLIELLSLICLASVCQCWQCTASSVLVSCTSSHKTLRVVI